jgi:hypothetical protein
MNEKIKQLAEKAGFYLWENEPWKPEGAVVDWSCDYDSELEKFAELIIRECANVAHTCIDDEWFDVGGAILDHFGVKK